MKPGMKLALLALLAVPCGMGPAVAQTPGQAPNPAAVSSPAAPGSPAAASGTPGAATPAPATIPPAAGAAAAPAAPAAPVLAAPTIPQPPGPAPDIWMPAGNAVLVLMNKVDSHPRQVTVPVGSSIRYGSLTITVKSCLARPADQIQDWAAFLDIVDSHADEPGFHGWMLAKEPWLGMLQHPVYDVRLLNCG